MFLRIFSAIGAFLDSEASGPVAFITAAIVCIAYAVIFAIATTPAAATP